MIQEKIIRDAIKAKLDSIVVDKSSATWNDSTDGERGQLITAVSYWRPELANTDVIREALLDTSIHVFLEWGDTDDYLNAHPNRQPIKANYICRLYLFTTSQKDPQGDLLIAEETVFDAINTLNYATYSTTGQRFSTNDDRSVSTLVMEFEIANIKLDT